MSRVLGITGNIACGKTAVGHMLLELGARRYIDADAVVHRLYESGQPVAGQIAETFGSGVIAADGGIDRRALGDIVFRDSQALKRLEQIVHPAVGCALIQEMRELSQNDIVVIDAVKLLEGGSGALCQSKWLIICSPEQQLARLIRRNPLSMEEARSRLAAQPDIGPKKALVDEIIDNSGALQQTQTQVAAAFTRFLRAFPARSVDGM